MRNRHRRSDDSATAARHATAARPHVGVANALDQEPAHRRRDDGVTAARHTTVARYVNAAGALDEEPDHRRGDDGATATRHATATRLRERCRCARHDGATDTLDQERGHRRTDDGTVDALNDVLKRAARAAWSTSPTRRGTRQLAARTAPTILRFDRPCRSVATSSKPVLRDPEPSPVARKQRRNNSVLERSINMRDPKTS